MRFTLLLSLFALAACETQAPRTKTETVVVDTVQTVVIPDLSQNSLNQTARIIAGITSDTDTQFADIRATEAWKSYAEESESQWKTYEAKNAKLYNWVQSEVLPLTENMKTIFYPLSGPDFLYGNLIFPHAETTYMFGLEEIGTIPDFSAIPQSEIDEYITFYKRSISDVLNYSFYRTNGMKEYLHNDNVDGVTPILMLFLVKSGKQISDISMVTLDENGVPQKVAQTDGFRKMPNRGVEIKYYNGTDNIERKLYFFTGNVADGALDANKAYEKYYQSLKPEGAFIKSATYLLHKPHFSVVRNAILDNCDVVVSDDSGIAYKFYDTKKWDVQLYGTYTRPIDMFANLYEKDLENAYKGSSNIKPLGFRIGYSNPSNMRIATRIK